MEDREANLVQGVTSVHERFKGCESSQRKKNDLLRHRIQNLNNLPDEVIMTSDILISGGIAPHQISGQLGYGSCKSGFINLTMHGHGNITIDDC